MDPADVDLKNLKVNLRSILQSAGYRGLTLEQLEQDYFDVCRKSLPVEEYGASSTQELLLNLPDVVQVIEARGEMPTLYYPVSVPETRHLDDLIERQKVHPPTRFGGSIPFGNDSDRNGAAVAGEYRSGPSQSSGNTMNKETNSILRQKLARRLQEMEGRESSQSSSTRVGPVQSVDLLDEQGQESVRPLGNANGIPSQQLQPNADLTARGGIRGMISSFRRDMAISNVGPRLSSMPGGPRMPAPVPRMPSVRQQAPIPRMSITDQPMPVLRASNIDQPQRPVPQFSAHVGQSISGPLDNGGLLTEKDAEELIKRLRESKNQTGIKTGKPLVPSQSTAFGPPTTRNMGGGVSYLNSGGQLRGIGRAAAGRLPAPANTNFGSQRMPIPMAADLGPRRGVAPMAYDPRPISIGDPVGAIRIPGPTSPSFPLEEAWTASRERHDSGSSIAASVMTNLPELPEEAPIIMPKQLPAGVTIPHSLWETIYRILRSHGGGHQWFDIRQFQTEYARLMKKPLSAEYLCKNCGIKSYKQLFVDLPHVDVMHTPDEVMFVRLLSNAMKTMKKNVAMFDVKPRYHSPVNAPDRNGTCPDVTQVDSEETVCIPRAPNSYGNGNEPRRGSVKPVPQDLRTQVYHLLWNYFRSGVDISTFSESFTKRYGSSLNTMRDCGMQLTAALEHMADLVDIGVADDGKVWLRPVDYDEVKGLYNEQKRRALELQKRGIQVQQKYEDYDDDEDDFYSH